MASRARYRNGSMMTEVVVAAGLLAAAFSVTAPLVVTSGRMWQQTRHQQLAMDELSNQMERLLVISEEQQAEALQQLAVSEQLAEVLVDARLTSEIIDDDDGKRLVLSMTWDRGVEALPLRLVGWLDAGLAEAAKTENGEAE